MKLFKNILRLCATAAAVLPLFGCGEDEYVKPSALLAESSLTFDAVGAEPQTLTIASDEAWFVDVDSDWITVDPASGSNTVDVTVSVSDNVTNGAMNAPREGTLTIANNRGYSVRTVIYQKGDTYLGVDEYDIAGLAALEDGTRAKVKETQVVALASDGFIAADASGAMYFLGNAGNVKIGDKVTMNGSSSTTNTVKTFTSDEVTIVSEASVSYPEAKDVTSTVGSYKPEAIEYVKVSGTLINKGLRVGSQTNAVTLYNPGIDIESVNLHKVVAYGYALLYAKTLYFVPTSFDDGGLDEDLTFYPVKYQIRKTPINFSTASFSAEGKIDPVEGLGYIQYVPFDLDNTNDNNKFALDVSDNSPRVIGPWPGDYWLFYCYGAVKAGSVMHITFEARTSATGHKYWMIEYLDGDVWKPAADKLKATDVPGGCEYTHAMNADGATNVKVDAEVKLKKNMDNCQFRFRCMANWQASGAGALATRNGGSGRLSVTDKDSDECQPKIIMVKEGDGVEIPDTDPIEANIVVSKDLLTFEGTPDAPKKLTVTSDYDFTIESSEKWLTLSATSGSANEELELSVTCEPSALSTLREATITIKSEESRKVINVVQSAAGGELDPLISISTGNSVEVLGQGAEFTAKIQANVDFETEISGSWITEVVTPATKAVVETVTKTFKAEPNLTGADRTGTIRFFKGNIESVLTVKQAKFEPSITVTYAGVNTIAGIGETRKLNIVSNVPFTVTAPSWIKLPTTNVPAAGTYPIDVVFDANTGDARTGQVVFKNDEYNYTYTVDVAQAAAGVCFFDDFGWLTPLIDTYTAAGGKVGDTIGNKKDDSAINIYGNAVKAFTLPAFANAGYEDMNPSLELIYLQNKYLKFNKTGGNNTSIRLPKLPLTAATDVTVEFDHAAMVQGSGTVDDSGVIIVIEGDGQFENGTKYSDVLKVNQPKGTYSWTHSSAKIKGATANTRLVVVMYRVLVKDDSGNYTGAYNYKVSGAGRIFIDNINIHK